MSDDSFDNDVIEYPLLDKIGAFTDKPECLVFLDTNPDKKYATKIEDLEQNTNDLIHFVMMRNEDISMGKATGECLIKQPLLVVQDMINNVDYQAAYIVVH